MPIRKVTKDGKTGYKWGTSGKTYFGPEAKKKAEAQARAIYASGYKKKK
jgi:hypothetical protein